MNIKKNFLVITLLAASSCSALRITIIDNTGLPAKISFYGTRTTTLLDGSTRDILTATTLCWSNDQRVEDAVVCRRHQENNELQPLPSVIEGDFDQYDEATISYYGDNNHYLSEKVRLIDGATYTVSLKENLPPCEPLYAVGRSRRNPPRRFMENRCTNAINITLTEPGAH